MQGCMSLACGRNGELLKTGEFMMVFNESVNMSEYNAEYARDFPPKKVKRQKSSLSRKETQRKFELEYPTFFTAFKQLSFIPNRGPDMLA